MIKLARRSLMAALMAGGVVASPAAHAEVTANVAVTSNYVWRGLSQTDDGAALQGGVDYVHDTGFYAGAWASNFKWVEEDDTGDEVTTDGVEYDLYAGYAREFGDIGVDVGVLTYNYTDADVDSATEIKLGVSYDLASFNYYIGDTGADADNEYVYYELGFDFDLADDVALALHYGINDPDVSGVEESEDYSVSITKDFDGIELGLSYADHEDEDGLFFVTVSREFEF